MMKTGKDSKEDTSVSALKVVANHIEGQEIAQLREENSKLRAVIALVDSQMQEKHDFHEHLVWHARGGHARARDEKYRQKYGEAKLKILQRMENKPISDWENGFRSGIMAATRLALGLTVMEDQHCCDGIHFDDCPSSEEEESDGDEATSDQEDEDTSDQKEEEQNDGNPRPVKIQKCGTQCYWTAEQQRQSAIDQFPNLDT